MVPESASERVAPASETAERAERADRDEREERDEPETVLVRVPADPDYLAIIRSASAHVATKFGCTLSEVSDLRLAVDEACGLMLRYTVPARRIDGAGDLECRFILDGPALRVVLSRQAADAAPPQNDDFGWTILGALVDDIVWRVEGPTVQVELLKRHMTGESAESGKPGE